MSKRNQSRRNGRNPNPNQSHGDINTSRDRYASKKEVEINIPDPALNAENLKALFNKKGKNDISWAQNLPQLLKDVASLPFGNPAGLKFSPFVPLGSMSSDASPYSVAGIGVAECSLTLGESIAPNSALNLAAEQIYILDRQANSGAVNYDKTDVMLTIGAMDSAYALYHWVVRAYRTLYWYDYMNRYIPDAVLMAMGFNPSNLRRNAADFRSVINQYVYRMSSVNVPDQFDFIQRHMWLCSNIYKDSNTDKAQLFMFNLSQIFVFTEGQNGQPSSLQPYVIPHNGLTVDDIANLFDTVMDPILGSQDVGTISGDLAKAFGENGMIKLMPVAEQETLEPVYNEEVLHCFLNMDIVNEIQIGAITQDLSSTKYGPWLKTNNVASFTSDVDTRVQASHLNSLHVMNINSDTPTPELSMTASRFMVNVNVTDEGLGTYGLVVDSVPSEVVTSFQISSLKSNGELDTHTFTSNGVNVAQSGQGLANLMTSLAMLSKFDWMPRIALYTTTGSGDDETVQYLGDLCDYYNYTLVQDASVNDLNDIYIMSLFKVKSWS